MQTASVVQAIDHGIYIQVLCADDRGLLSIYFDHGPFELFSRRICRAGLKLKGLQIKHGGNIVYVPALGRTNAGLRTH